MPALTNRSKCAVLLVTAAGVLIATPSYGGPTTHPRVVRSPYTVAGVAGVISGSATAQDSSSGGVVVATRRSERRVAVSVVDETGTVAGGVVSQTSSSGDSVELGEFCGATSKPLPIAFRGRPIAVYVLIGSCGGAAVASQGTATVSLSS